MFQISNDQYNICIVRSNKASKQYFGSCMSWGENICVCVIKIISTGLEKGYRKPPKLLFSTAGPKMTSNLALKADSERLFKISNVFHGHCEPPKSPQTHSAASYTQNLNEKSSANKEELKKQLSVIYNANIM